MQKIGLIELAKHNEVLRSYLILLLNIKNIDICVFTSSWIFDQCYDLQKEERINWVLKKELEKTNKYIDRNKEKIYEQDLIIQTTDVDENGKLLKIPNHRNLALVIHDLHTYFDPFSNLIKQKSLKNLLKIIRFYLFKKRGLANLVEMATTLILPSENVHKYAIDKYKDKATFVQLPFTINDEISREGKGKNIIITIPGNVSNKSRDYNVVIKALHLLPKNLGVIINILGRPDGDFGMKVVNSFKEIRSLKVNSYKAFIPQKEFDTVMRNTDFLILPMNKIMKFDIIGEVNGHSCVSGNMNDMIRYGIPAMIPDYYPLPLKLKSVVYQYESEQDLCSEIEKWVHTKKYNKLKGDVMELAMQNYSKDSLSDLFHHNFTSKKM